MPFSHIFEEDLPTNLLMLKNLSAIPSKERGKKKHLIFSKITEIFESLEEYLKKLPSPISTISCRDRIVIFNCRQIFHGLALVIEVEIKALFEQYKKDIRRKEQALKLRETSTSEITLKKKVKKTQGQLPPVESIDMTIRGDIFPHYSDVKCIAIGKDILWSEESFLEDLRQAELPQADILPREPEIPIVDDQGFRESLPPPLMESTKLGPRLDSIELPPLPSQVDLEVDLIRDDSRRLPSMAVQERPESPRPETEHVRQLDAESLMNEIENIVSKTPPQIKKPVKKGERLPKLFSDKTHMSKEEYIKFLTRKPKDPVKFYTKWGDDLDKYFYEPTEEDLIEADMFEHKYLIEEPKGTIPIGKIHFRDTSYAEPPENIHEISIPEFEFHPVDDIRAIGYHQKSFVDTIRDAPSRVSRGIDEMAAPLQLDDLPLERTLIDLPTDQHSLHHDEGIVFRDTLHEIPEPHIILDQSPQRSTLFREYQDKLWLQLNNLCMERENSTIVFTDLCGLSETSLNASRTFCYLLDLWSKNKIEVYQTSDDPKDIYIKLLGNVE